ncbi:MAG: flagellar hook-length control protein FliK [Pedococcus sp.]
MTPVTVNPAAPATASPARAGGRNTSAEDASRFEVAIRSQLESGRGSRAGGRVDPADPRGRSTVSERSQRPTPDPVFERPTPSQPSSHHPASKHPTPNHPSANHPTANRPASNHPTPTKASHDAPPASRRSSDSAVAAGSTPSEATSPQVAENIPAPTADAGTATIAATVTIPAAVALAAAPVPVGDQDAPGTTSGVVGPAGVTGATAQDTPATDQSEAVHSTSEQAGSPQAGTGQTGTGQTGTGQTGAGEPGSAAPTLVHGRPAALTGAPRPDGAVETDPAALPTAAPQSGADSSAVPTSSATVTAIQTATPAIPLATADAASNAAAAASVAPTAATTGAATATPVAPAPNPVVPPPPQAQVLSAMSPLLTGPDGTHRVTVHLEPENLGKVRVQLSLSGGEVAVHLIAADAATRETLRQGLPELRAQLELSGLRTAGMDVQSGSADLFGREAGAGAGGGAAPRGEHGAIPGHRTTTADTPTPPNPTARSLSHDVALDVRM